MRIDGSVGLGAGDLVMPKCSRTWSPIRLRPGEGGVFVAFGNKPEGLVDELRIIEDESLRLVDSGLLRADPTRHPGVASPERFLGGVQRESQTVAFPGHIFNPILGNLKLLVGPMKGSADRDTIGNGQGVGNGSGFRFGANRRDRLALRRDGFSETVLG